MQRAPASPSSAARRLSISPALMVFLFAFIARLWVLFQAADTPDFLPNQGDMKFYSDWARRIAGGTWTDHQAFYGLPGYAYWLAFIYRVVGYQPYVAAFIQGIAEAFTAMWIFKLAPLAFMRPGAGDDPAERRRCMAMGVIAPLGWVFCTPAQAYATVLMPTAYLICAFWFVVWWVLRKFGAGRPSTVQFLLLGLLSGVVAMMVANILFLIPLVLAAIFLRQDWAHVPERPFGAKARTLACTGLLAGVLIGVSPCALHNYFAAGEPVLLSAHGGINFFIGNNALANGYPLIPAPLHADQEGMLKDSIHWAERAAGHPLKRAEVSAYWNGLANRFIREHPMAWLRLLCTKLGNFWNGFQYDDLGVLSPLGEDGVLLPGIGFATAVTLGLPGLFLAAWRRPRSRWIIAAVLLHMASLMTVFVTERYRLAAMPGLLLLASFGLVEIWQEITVVRGWKTVAAYGVLVIGSFMLSHRPVEARVRELDDYNSSLADFDKGLYDRARIKLQRVLANSPDNAETNFALGNVFFAQGDDDQAKRFYRHTLQLDPRHYRALNNLGVIASKEKRWPIAETFLVGSLAIQPDAKTQFLLAQVRQQRGDVAGAKESLAAAIRLQPDNPEFEKLGRELATPNIPVAPATSTAAAVPSVSSVQ